MDTGSEQATFDLTQVGDVQTDTGSGQTGGSDGQTVDATDAKKWRKSDEEWQQMVELKQKLPDLLSTAKEQAKQEALRELALKLGVDPTEKQTPEQALQERLSAIEAQNVKLQRDAQRFSWERTNADTMKAIDPLKWEEINSSDKYSALSYEERALLARKPDSPKARQSEQQARQHEQSFWGSVPPSGSSTGAAPQETFTDIDRALGLV